jgi:antitoxin (DNA-binding transcriptional repressor) of toxin-antitoxin stability system
MMTVCQAVERARAIASQQAFLDRGLKRKCYSQGKKAPEIGDRQSQMAITVDVPEITAKFSELLSHIQLGEEVVITDAGVPIARLTAIPKSASPRIPGQDKGKVVIAEDFNDPLPPDLLNGFLGLNDQQP